MGGSQKHWYRLNHKDTSMDLIDVPFVQNATANYYTNHSSSSSMKPKCAQNGNGTAQWYRANTHKTYQMTVSSGTIYQIRIQIALREQQDAHVMLSDIAMLCVNIPPIHISPTFNPTMRPTISSLNNVTLQYTTDFVLSSMHSTDVVAIATKLWTHSTAMDNPDDMQSANENELQPMNMLWIICGILLMVTCCCLCAIGCLCITIHVKLQSFHSVSVEQMNSCVADVDINVIQLDPEPAPGQLQSPAHSSTESTHLIENSASFMDRHEGQEMGERNLQIAIVRDDENEKDGRLIKRNITHEVDVDMYMEVDTK